MPRNVELKARCPDPAAVASAALAAGAEDRGVLVQHDTFYAAATGRLKLRRFADGSAELIAYHRPDVAGEKGSDYIVSPVADADALHHALSAVLGATGDVRKARRLLTWRNVRIHLDDVAGLGSYLEFEAVVSPECDEAASRRNLAELRQILEVRDEDLVDVAYADLLAHGRR